MVKNLNIYSEKKNKIDKYLIHRLIKFLKNELKFTFSAIQINFVSADQITQINKKYLKHDYSTDIVTFDYSVRKQPIDAELYISVEDARFNARKFGVTFDKEIKRLVIHGILHLLEFDDKTKEKKKIMKRHENNLLSKFIEIESQGTK